jgi:hypothetical protein
LSQEFRLFFAVGTNHRIDARIEHAREPDHLARTKCIRHGDPQLSVAPDNAGS